MPAADGYFVDLDALLDAHRNLRRLLSEMDEHPVRDLDCPAGSFGHDRLAAATADFCARHQRGTTHLLEDAEAVANQLASSITTYLDAEANARSLFDSVDGSDD